MAPDEERSSGELGRWMGGFEKRMEAGFAEVKAQVQEVKTEMRTLGFVRQDVYTSDREAHAREMTTLKEYCDAQSRDLRESVARNWALTWALLAVMIVAIARANNIG